MGTAGIAVIDAGPLIHLTEMECVNVARLSAVAPSIVKFKSKIFNLKFPMLQKFSRLC